MKWLVIISVIVVGAAACAPELGDGCTDALDCAVDGTRTCDTTQPGGYCLIQGCRADECPDEGVCVRFGVAARARTFCMRVCTDGGDECRGAYGCVQETPLMPGETEDPLAVYTEVVDELPEGDRFCTPAL